MLYAEYRKFEVYGKKNDEISIQTTIDWREENDQYITNTVKRVVEKSPQAIIRLEKYPIDKERIDESVNEALKILRADKQKPFWMD